MTKQETILVTGASGFVGSRLCERLKQEGANLILLTSASGDIRNSKTFDQFLSLNVDHVFHCAANTFVPASWECPANFIDVNVIGTNAVLEFCRKKETPLTFVSAYIYGNKVSNPIREDAMAQPSNPYALSKKMGEELCHFYSSYFNVKVNIVRPFNIYGPGQKEHFLIPFILKQAIEKDRIEVKDLFPKRDYIYIDDVISCLIKAKEYKNFGIFNAGSGVSYSVKEVIETALDVLGKKVEIVSENLVRPNEISDTVADISNARNLLGWHPEVGLKDGLKRMVMQHV